MANNLPPGAIPKLYRQRNKSGQEVGAWYIRVKGTPVNLRTQDYMKARERAVEAYQGGKREFSDDRYSEQSPPLQLEAVKERLSSGHPVEVQFRDPPKPTQLPQSSGSDDWTSDVSSAASNGIVPDAVIPPFKPPADAPKPPPVVDATVVGEEQTKSSESEAPKDDYTKIDPKMLDSIVKQAAMMAVELQLLGQEWLAARALKIKMGPVPEGHNARVVPAQIWEQWLRTMVPTDLPIPPWLAAPLVLMAMSVPVQLEGATPIKKEPPKDS